jgi:SAM-dependent methyltransferase
MDVTAQSHIGAFAATGLASGAVDAAMTVDALQYAPDKAAALEEIARILRPGGRFAFVAFELDPQRIAGLPVWSDPIADYRPLLEAAGLALIAYRQLDDWERRVTATFGAVLHEQAALERELGEAAATAW